MSFSSQPANTSIETKTLPVQSSGSIFPEQTMTTGNAGGQVLVTTTSGNLSSAATSAVIQDTTTPRSSAGMLAVPLLKAIGLVCIGVLVQ